MNRTHRAPKRFDDFIGPLFNKQLIHELKNGNESAFINAAHSGYINKREARSILKKAGRDDLLKIWN